MKTQEEVLADSEVVKLIEKYGEPKVVGGKPTLLRWVISEYPKLVISALDRPGKPTDIPGKLTPNVRHIEFGIRTQSGFHIASTYEGVLKFAGMA